MQESNSYSDQFDNLVSGTLSTEEKEKMLYALQNDNLLKEEFKLYMAVRKAAEKSGSISLKNELNSIHQKTISSAGSWYKNGLYTLLAMLALVAAFVAGRVSEPEKTKTIVQEKIVHDTVEVVKIITDTIVVEKTVTVKEKAKKTKETAIKVVNSNMQFAYKYFDGQLILYGEYNKNKARFAQKNGNDYLVYENKVFLLTPTKVAKPLIETADPGLLSIPVGNSELEKKFTNKNENVPTYELFSGIRLMVQEGEIQNSYMYDGVYLVLYGTFRDKEKTLVKNSDGTLFLTFDKTEFYQIFSAPGKIQKLKPLKNQSLEKAKYTLEGEER